MFSLIESMPYSIYVGSLVVFIGVTYYGQQLYVQINYLKRSTSFLPSVQWLCLLSSLSFEP